MSTLHERLKTVRGGLSQAAFARLLEIPQTTWSNYENDKSKPDYALIDTLCSRFNLNVEWLLYGRGSMHAKEESTHAIDINLWYEILNEAAAGLYEALRITGQTMSADEFATAVIYLHKYFISNASFAEKTAAIFKVIQGENMADQ